MFPPVLQILYFLLLYIYPVSRVSFYRFLTDSSLPPSQQGFDRALEQSYDSIRAKAQWVERDRRDVEAWLKSNGFLDGV